MSTLEILCYLAEFTAAIFAAVFYKKFKQSNVLKLILPYLWYTVTHDFVSYILLKKGWIQFQLANLYTFITVLLMLWMIYKKIQNRNHKIFIKIVGLLFVLLAITEFYIRGFADSWQLTDTTGSLLVILSFALYCIHLFSTKENISLTRDMFTYIILGFTIYFVASPIIYMTVYYNAGNYNLVLKLKNINFVIIVIMYLIFSFGFYWGDTIQEAG